LVLFVIQGTTSFFVSADATEFNECTSRLPAARAAAVAAAPTAVFANADGVRTVNHGGGHVEQVGTCSNPLHLMRSPVSVRGWASCPVIVDHQKTSQFTRSKTVSWSVRNTLAGTATDRCCQGMLGIWRTTTTGTLET
jgi:hypothetical protein